MKFSQVAVAILCGLFVLTQGEFINRDVALSNVDRSIDLLSQIAKIYSKVTVANNGKIPVGHIHYALEEGTEGHLAYIGAITSDGKTQLKITPAKITGRENLQFWRINLRDDLKPGKKILLEIEAYYTHTLKPFPVSITQKDIQLILFEGNIFFYSPYTVFKQSTIVHIGTRNVESFTEFKPFTQTDTTIYYGPFDDMKAYSTQELFVHYENNSPFLVVVNLERKIEVSHWGNVAVEEVISMEHKGAALKGSFSRYEFQRDAQSGLSSVKSYKTLLPASAKDVYYRDEIGNISTSHLRVLADSIELDLRPRFPIFGGWKTQYTIGYNIPSYEYLFNAGSDFLLKMRLVDHVFDDMVIDDLTTKFILPEGAQNIKLKTPYPVNRRPDEKVFTYLDTIGRPAIIINKKNLIENHIQDFELKYTFPRFLMLQEPLLLMLGIFALFSLGIIYVRSDLSLSKEYNSKKET